MDRGRSSGRTARQETQEAATPLGAARTDSMRISPLSPTRAHKAPSRKGGAGGSPPVASRWSLLRSPYTLLAAALLYFALHPLFLRTPETGKFLLPLERGAPSEQRFTLKGDPMIGAMDPIGGEGGTHGQRHGSVDAADEHEDAPDEEGPEGQVGVDEPEQNAPPGKDRGSEGTPAAQSPPGSSRRKWGKHNKEAKKHVLEMEAHAAKVGGGGGGGGGGGAVPGDHQDGAAADQQDGEDYMMDEAEVEAMLKEKEAAAQGRNCRCKDGASHDCDGDKPHHRAVAAVCSIEKDIRDMYHWHRWRQGHRLDEAAFSERVQEAAAPFAGSEGAHEKQITEVGTKLVRSRRFRLEIVRKMRDAFGRRYQLPKPLNVFNDALLDPEGFGDLDQEDAYLSVLATRVLNAVRDSMSDPKFMSEDKLFYSLENHERLREKHDPIRNDTARFLPSESPVLRYGTCAVVGNSGGLLEDKIGAEINAHDLVIRTNQAPSFRYEQHVGNRTNMRILNKKWTDTLGRRHMELMKHDARDVVAISSRANVREFTLLARALQKAKPHGTPLFLSTHVVTGAMRFLRLFRSGINAGLPRHIRGGNTASSGFLGVFLATKFCDKVSVYGFSLEECRSNGCSRQYHYFKGIADSDWLRAHPSHSFELEGLVLRAMHVLGMACLYPFPVVAGECGSLKGIAGEDGTKPLNLYKALESLQLANATRIPIMVEVSKPLMEAERIEQAARKAEREAAERAGKIRQQAREGNEEAAEQGGRTGSPEERSDPDQEQQDLQDDDGNKQDETR